MQGTFRKELQTELENILRFWMEHTIDERHGGFKGRIMHNGAADAYALKGVVLNARILWTFSVAHRYDARPEYIATARRAYAYITEHFIDTEFGGVYWTVDYTGKPVDTKKQIYALSFAAYAFSEYYKAAGEELAKEQAIALYRLIEQHAYDPEHGGYFEAFSRDWGELKDLRLSAKDANEKKTMNTHLHVLEAYANLYTVWPDDGLKRSIIGLLNVFYDKMLNTNKNRLSLFFDERWQVKGNLVSYGHDIEAAWLMQEAAEIIKAEEVIQKFREVAVRMAETALEGVDEDGGMWYEYDADADHLVREKHWWPQAEAVVGFLNAWQLSRKERFLRQAEASWQFIRRSILDKQHGEWFWGIDAEGKPMQEDKAGLWKCPYHNARACLEGIRRLT
ncbi:AGE family epimerase/isomerase [Chitinophaga sp. GCM10012297]|uniref:Cellobiose 2-epimerase n=1 Tax=Chitinophaga chungangae TaxID=2821488 RepID=A0ABS3YAS2_9BACT|nr:AGE family epimerase/isomerase [Chitinophaga chungangae]MBO9151775.1 AGE family epimerase/isomerase [Chitinophaga chungangae]